MRRPGPIDDTSSRARQTGDLAHLGVAQFKIKQHEVFLEPFCPARARDYNYSLLNEPPQANLCRRLTMGPADPFQYFVPLCAAARDRAVSHDGHAVLAAGADHLVLVEERMTFNLIADQGLS